jgi:hypothetical protein
MTASMVLMVGLNLGGTPAMEYQPTAIEPKSAIEIIRDLTERLKVERARHERKEAVNLRVGPVSSKAELDTYRLRIGNIEKKTQESVISTADFEAMSKRLGDAVKRIDIAAEADRAARTSDALSVFEKEGLKRLLVRVQCRQPKEVKEEMNKILAAINSELATSYTLGAELSEMLNQQKDQLANCQRAADREDAAQRKLGGLNIAIFALDGALRLVRVEPMAK